MALNKVKLKSDIKKAFEESKAAGMKTPPDDENAILEKLCVDLSNAIHAYVTGGDVVGVEVGVAATGGAFKQTKNGKVQ
jgi:hypothetical protein